MSPYRPGPRGAAGPVATRAAALVLLAAVCVGVPVWLAVMGGTPFARVDLLLPLRAVTGGHAPSVGVPAMSAWLGQVALVVAWSAWAWAVTCILLEARYWRSGRAPAHLPGSRTMQWVVAGLVGAAFALGGAARSPHDLRPVGSHAAHIRPGVAVVPVGGEGAGPPDLPDRTGPRAGGSEPSPVPPPQGAVSLDVRVAADGSGGPWATAVRRADRRDGSVPAADQVASGDRSPVPVPPGDVHTPPSADHTVAARETLWSVAEQRLGSARRWRELAELNYGRVQPDGGHLGADHWIRPGWVLLLPAPTVVGSPPEPERGPVRDAPGRPGVSHVPGRPPAPVVPPVPVVPVVPVGAGVVGVGVSELVDRLRKVQQRHRAPGTSIRLPDPVLRQFEQRVRVGDGGEVLRAAEDAVRDYCAPRPSGGPRPGVVGVRVSEDEVELVVDGPVATDGLPPGWNTTGDPTTVSIDRGTLERWSTEGRDRAEGLGRRGRGAFPLPTLVAIGRVDGRVLFLHLEGLGALVLDGERVDTEGVVRALALELATSRWSSGFDLVLVGFGVDLERLDHVSVTGAAGPLAADLAWRRLRDSVRLDDGGFSTVLQARCEAGSSDWDPVVVVCGPGLPASDVQALVAVGAEGGGGVAVVAVSDPGTDHGAARRVTVGPRGEASALGLLDDVLEPQQVTEIELAQVMALVDVATVGSAPDGAVQDPDQLDPDLDPAPRGVPERSAVRPPTDGGDEEPAGAVPALVGKDTGTSVRVPPTSTSRRPREIEVEVAVLGPVEIRGAAREFTRAWAKELVVYLALHPDGAANDVWATALWPERVMAPSSLHSTVSVARRALGTAHDGTDHLPRAHGRLRLGPAVGTDWERFQELAAGDDTDAWRRALELVRGRPFEGMRASDWSVLDGTAPAVESAVVDLSGRLAGASLRAGDPRGAEWSARRGLLVSPYDERLYRMLLRAADAAGNPGGVESVMAELVRVVADDIEPVESVHPSTLALYRSLSRRRVGAL